MVGGLPRGLPRVWGRSSFALELPPRARALQCLALEIYVSAPGAPPAGAVASGVVQLNLGGLMPEGLQDIGRGTLGLAKWLAMTRLFHGAQLAGCSWSAGRRSGGPRRRLDPPAQHQPEPAHRGNGLAVLQRRPGDAEAED